VASEKRRPPSTWPGRSPPPADTDAWYQHIVPVRGRRLELLKAAESGGVLAVQRLIAGWGLVWGRDVLPAPADADSAEE
jgi:hypothetical protein